MKKAFDRSRVRLLGVLQLTTQIPWFRLKILVLCLHLNCLSGLSLVFKSPVHGKASSGKPALSCTIPGMPILVSIMLTTMTMMLRLKRTIMMLMLNL